MAINSANMNLPIPQVGVDEGPTWADNINSSLTIIDAHDHASGSGVQITPDGINISSDLSFGSQNAIGLRSSRFTSQASPLADPTDLGCLYVSGVDLYYNDGSGNQVRMTQSGGVAGSPGTIGSLVSPASATYVSATQTFVWESDASEAANMDMGGITLRPISPSAFGITIEPPALLAADYGLTLPGSLPAASSYVTVNSSGTLSFSSAVSSGTTGSSVASFTTTATSFTAVTGLTVTVTTTGRPVFVGLRSTTTGAGSSNIGVQGNLAAPSGDVAIYRDATNLGNYQISHQQAGYTSGTVAGSIPSSSVFTVDAPGAGTYTYAVYLRSGSSSITTFVNNVALVAYEL